MTDAPVFHGGDLSWADTRFGRPNQPWIDLSTGVNPWPYPVGAVDAAAWTRLPEGQIEADMRAAAARYYGAPGPACIVAAPGSQALIQLLPRLRPRSRVAVVGPTYGEHAPCWEAGGHIVTTVEDGDMAGRLFEDPWDVIVLTNPNNPDGRVHHPDVLDEIAERLSARGGWLVVDEAFADTAPEYSLAPTADRPGRIVLRSFGKFFGLAGLRLGFALAPPEIARDVAAALGPWAVSGPAIEIAMRAFRDDTWIAATRARLASAAAGLDAALRDGGLDPSGSCPLFRYVEHPSAASVFQVLGEHGILVRHFPDRSDRLRLGLPADDAALKQLVAAIAAARAAVRA